jgi:hypothetical protein
MNARCESAWHFKLDKNLEKAINMKVLPVLVAAFFLVLSSMASADETQAALKAQAKITQADAEKTALAKVPGGKIESSELENEHGKLIWSFDISVPNSVNIAEVQVDAKNGKIVSNKTETPKDQAKEVAADKKKK